MMTRSLLHSSEGYTIFNGTTVSAITALSGLLAFSLSGYVVADEESMKLPAIQFSIKPRLCVLAAGEEVCRDELEVTWAAEEARSLCLYQSGETLPLRCWENKTRGAYQFTITASTSVDFHLREDEGKKALGSEVFEVVYDQKKFRKQRRNPWSFF